MNGLGAAVTEVAGSDCFAWDSMDIDGPACGSVLARTRVLITYSVGGALLADRSAHCCFRHVPDACDAVPDGAVIEEVVIEDGLSRTRIAISQVAERAIVTITAIDPEA